MMLHHSEAPPPVNDDLIGVSLLKASPARRDALSKHACGMFVAKSPCRPHRRHDQRNTSVSKKIAYCTNSERRETSALLSVAVFGIDLSQFLKTTPCERRFRTDAQFGARPCYAPTEPFLILLPYGSYDFYCTGGRTGGRASARLARANRRFAERTQRRQSR